MEVVPIQRVARSYFPRGAYSAQWAVDCGKIPFTSVGQPLLRQPIMVDGNSNGRGNPPTLSVLHADNHTLAHGLDVDGFPAYRRKLQADIEGRFWL